LAPLIVGDPVTLNIKAEIPRPAEQDQNDPSVVEDFDFDLMQKVVSSRPVGWKTVMCGAMIVLVLLAVFIFLAAI
jgi:hypothetical protein